jgi:Threonine synthase
LINQAYADNFDTKEVINLSQLDENTYFNELWHGPTASFKDLALQIKPLLFSKALEKNKEKLDYLILVATSGDTGSAALSGYKDKKTLKLSFFFPKMASLQFKNYQ